MAEENEGVTGLKSLRLHGMKISELPLGMSNHVAEQIPNLIAQERKNRIDAIVHRYPKGTRAQYEARIKECEHNVKGFAAERIKTRERMDNYQMLMRSNTGRDPVEVEEEVTQLVIERGKPQPGTDAFTQLVADIEALNAQTQPYDGEAMWQQIKQFQDDVERYEVAITTEHESIADMKGFISQLGARDALIKQAMEETIEVE